MVWVWTVLSPPPPPPMCWVLGSQLVELLEIWWKHWELGPSSREQVTGTMPLKITSNPSSLLALLPLYWCEQTLPHECSPWHSAQNQHTHSWTESYNRVGGNPPSIDIISVMDFVMETESYLIFYFIFSKAYSYAVEKDDVFWAPILSTALICLSL